MRRLGLTGGIGSGKSTVASMLAQHGATLIDADAISRQLTAAGGAAIPHIRACFGATAVAVDGAMNRDFIRQLAFNDPRAKHQLEAIIHPLVSAESVRQVRRAEVASSACVVFDIPLLVESGQWRQRLDAVLVIDCSEASQISRVMARSHWLAEAVQKVIAAQASRAQRRAAADMIIYNDGISLACLQQSVAQIAAMLKL